MPAACRADVEALLRNKKLDRTLVPMGTTGAAGVVLQETVKTGLFELDQQLGGGLPLGQMSEIVGPRSSGRTSLLMAILAAATSRGEMVALVDTFDLFDPESAAAAGVDLHRMLWVRGDPCAPAFPLLANRQAGADRAITRALKATNLILQSGVFGVMALDLADAPPQALRRVPMTTWLRFQRVLEEQEAVGVIVGSAPMSRSAGGVSVSLHPRGLGVGDWGLRSRESEFPSTRSTESSLGAGGIRDSGGGIWEKAWDRRAPLRLRSGQAARQAGAGVVEWDSPRLARPRVRSGQAGFGISAFADSQGISASVDRRDSGFPPSSIRGDIGYGVASGIWDSGRVFRGLESDVRTARARLVPGADASPVRLRVTA